MYLGDPICASAVSKRRSASYSFSSLCTEKFEAPSTSRRSFTPFMRRAHQEYATSTHRCCKFFIIADFHPAIPVFGRLQHYGVYPRRDLTWERGHKSLVGFVFVCCLKGAFSSEIYTLHAYARYCNNPTSPIPQVRNISCYQGRGAHRGALSDSDEMNYGILHGNASPG